jgi:hypothetical protein
VESIAGAFAGEEKSVLQRALLAAGAHRVEFASVARRLTRRCS